MTYGPLEFARYLARKEGQKDSAAVQAARAAAPAARIESNRLTVISGGSMLSRVARGARVDAVSVYEAVAMRVPAGPRARAPVRVRVDAARPVVLVLSGHEAVHWEITLAQHSALCAVLLSGYGESTVAGAGAALVTSIGGFYAFRRGSPEFKHLESEVLRCTGRYIDTFQSAYAGSTFDFIAENAAATPAVR